MVLLKSCCCWQSVRNGSLASGIYTMTFYTIISTAASFHMDTVLDLREDDLFLLVVSILTLILGALSVICSIVLIIGLCKGKRMLLMPWIVCITIITIFDIILSFYLMFDHEFDPFAGTLIAVDYFFCSLNIYCILCVTSQYQEYSRDINRPIQAVDPEGLPEIHLDAASTVRPNRSSDRMVSTNVIQKNGSPTTSVCRPLLSSGGTLDRWYRSTVPSNFNSTSSTVLMLSRCSFSSTSTSEISFSSSDVLSSSRRSSALPSQDVTKQGLSPVGEVNPFPSPSIEMPETFEVQNAEDPEGNTKLDKRVGKDSTLTALNEIDEEKATPSTSGFHVPDIFSTMKSAQTMIKINIFNEEEQLVEDIPKETTHDLP